MNIGSPKIAAVIVTYNRKNELLKTIRWIRDLKDAAVDMIIIDNCGVDGSMEAVDDLKNSHIHYLRQNQNLGSAGGFAVGMEYGLVKKYDFVWLFNDDSRPHPDAFSSLIN